jgi:Kef-type K+ transport system membrane component KefB
LFLGAAMSITAFPMLARIIYERGLTGTSLGTLALAAGAKMLLIALAVIGAACLGNGGACWVAARLNGEDNRTALAVGALRNSRGLMELIIINVGLQKGVIQPGLFSILVLMAIVTTLMTTPVFE